MLIETLKQKLFALAEHSIQTDEGEFQTRVRRDADALLQAFQDAATTGKYSLLVTVSFACSDATAKQYGECVKRRVKNVSDLDIKYMVHYNENSNSTVQTVTFDAHWMP